MANKRPQAESVAPEGAGHEPYEVGIRRIFIFGFVLVLVTIGSMIAMAVLMRQFKREETRRDRDRPHLFRDESGQYPAPRLQRNDELDMANLREAELKTLANYGWVDPKGGVARIPIERAKALVLENGLPPVRKPQTPDSRKK